MAEVDALSRRGLARLFGWLGTGWFGLGCHRSDGPDTELPTEQLGPDFRKLRHRVRKQVRDCQRREAALALIEQIDTQLGRVDVLLVEWRTKLAALPEDIDRAQVEALIRRHSEQLGELAREVGRLAFELRRHISADEWPRVFPPPSTEQEHDSPW